MMVMEDGNGSGLGMSKIDIGGVGKKGDKDQDHYQYRERVEDVLTELDLKYGSSSRLCSRTYSNKCSSDSSFK